MRDIMRYENKIGKKVWLFDGSLEHGFRLRSKDTFTLKEVKMGADCHDWANHYVIEHDSDGQTLEVREFQVVFALAGDNIYQYLADNEIYAEVSDAPDGTVTVDISWGDWKHEHLWCRDLMGYIGYEKIDERVTEENGDDAYSAIHTYRKTA